MTTGLKLHNLIAWKLADDFKFPNIIVNQKLGDKTTTKKYRLIKGHIKSEREPFAEYKNNRVLWVVEFVS